MSPGLHPHQSASTLWDLLSRSSPLTSPLRFQCPDGSPSVQKLPQVGSASNGTAGDARLAAGLGGQGFHHLSSLAGEGLPGFPGLPPKVQVTDTTLRPGSKGHIDGVDGVREAWAEVEV